MSWYNPRGWFKGRAQKPIPAEATRLLELIPSVFKDDGLSMFPDRWAGFNFKWAGKIHDWWYCTRAHTAGLMNVRAKKRSDRQIGRFVNSALPTRWKFMGPIVRLGVWRGGYGSYNSCGPIPSGATDEQLVQGKCRHDLPQPPWMKKPV